MDVLAADDAECNAPCPHDGAKMCGGSERISIYELTVIGQLPAADPSVDPPADPPVDTPENPLAEGDAKDINACEKLCSDQASTCHSF